MSRKRSPLTVEVLSFLLATLLGIAIGNLNNSPGALPAGLEFVRRQSLPLAGITVLSIIGVMIWQRRAEERSGRPDWDSDRSPFPGLEAFTELDSAVFFGREAETTELLERLHPVIAGQVNRLIAVVGPSGAGKSSLVQAGVVPRLRRRRNNWLVVPSVLPGDHPLRSLARSLEAVGSASNGTPAARFSARPQSPPSPPTTWRTVPSSSSANLRNPRYSAPRGELVSRYIGEVCPSWASPNADTNIAPSRVITRQVGSMV